MDLRIFVRCSLYKVLSEIILIKQYTMDLHFFINCIPFSSAPNPQKKNVSYRMKCTNFPTCFTLESYQNKTKFDKNSQKMTLFLLKFSRN